MQLNYEFIYRILKDCALGTLVSHTLTQAARRKTFSAPSAIASVPLVDIAGELVPPFAGWAGCASSPHLAANALQRCWRLSSFLCKAAKRPQPPLTWLCLLSKAQDANGTNCVNGDVSGGTILAWDTSGFGDWAGFWNPLLGTAQVQAGLRNWHLALVTCRPQH